MPVSMHPLGFAVEDGRKLLSTPPRRRATGRLTLLAVRVGLVVAAAVRRARDCDQRRWRRGKVGYPLCPITGTLCRLFVWRP
ncbi:MAG: hypothetical protein JO268_16225 [Pseudonocardiales bacterium]|nr:hypothetical protein [Pseudonocardiales bacterium]